MSFTASLFTAAASDPASALGLPAFQLDLEAAHAALRRAAIAIQDETEPTVDLAPAARALEQAFGALYDAIDGRADRPAAVDAARAHLDLAAAALESNLLAPLREEIARARGYLGAAAARLAAQPPWPAPPAASIRASTDVPTLHEVARRSLVPVLRVQALPPPAPPPPAPPPRPKTFAELDEAVALLEARTAAAMNVSLPGRATRSERAVPAAPALPGFTRDLGAAVDDVTFLRTRARDCFEDVVMVGFQRTPQLGDDWRASATLDRRMLAAIDLLAAIGPVAIDHVPRLFAEAPVKDGCHGFALAMTLGCFRGRDALAAAELALLDRERAPDLVDEIGRALKLVPHDALPLTLRALLREPDARIRAMAIDVLGHRGLAPDDELAAATRDAPEVAARAFRHLVGAPPAVLWPLLDDAGEPADGDLREAVWTALAMSGHPRASGVLRAALDGADARMAALLLALGGDHDDARELTRRAGEVPDAGLIEAVGWSGAGSAVGPLVALLDRDDEEIRIACGAALEQITAAGLWEEVEVADDDILVPDPPDPDIGDPTPRKLAQLVSDPRELPPAPAPERVVRPATDPARWQAWLRARSEPFAEQARHRRGQLYTPLVTLGELDSGTLTPRERRLVQCELIARTGGFVRFDPHDFVAVQEEAIRAWQPLAARASATPGQWTRAARRAR